ncbi:uncharacterized protein BO97DRAFT_458675 [Aspergillus homomorphus CBS 101889]|uniref:Uncharacterized protein n=1 Tax=Aspergillus homomorphus (strain CBS 101889) TaxID=1450537 RepID=A0A395I787_ASPHC|nr:hypothetical protein BO97DRAFT_458675 [Aspergillus homomorphus CBS 101889]RAL15785.1 hypothetical protein BO97DRAFT_458675 [Aspergillus homomorphus CBS 101889]
MQPIAQSNRNTQSKMRWTPENMSILWETFFESHNLTIDVDKMAAIWPNPITLVADGEEKPTARAIKERLEKFRRNLKNGGITFSMGTKRASNQDSPAKATPKKKRVTKKMKDEAKVKAEEDETLHDSGDEDIAAKDGTTIVKEEDGDEAMQEPGASANDVL